MGSGENRKRRILILSSSNPFKKSAGIVALDLYHGLKKIKGNDVTLLIEEYGKFTDSNIISMKTRYKDKKSWIKRNIKRTLIKYSLLNNKLLNTDKDYYIQNYDQTKKYYSTQSILKKAGFHPDVVIVLFSEKFLSHKNLYELNTITNAPIFILMMDMEPMTGGCHYAWDCEGYLKKCGNCPAYYSTIEQDQSRKNWKYKKRYIEKMNITVIAASEWQVKQLHKSSLFDNKNKYKILSPTNNVIFKTGNKIAARKKLSLPLNKRIIFFGAISVNDKRKGFNELAETLEILYSNLNREECKNVHLAIAGNNTEELIKTIKFDLTNLGHISKNNLAKVYQASDIFLNTSIEDSGPTMINQSIMSGTPVVAFEMGVALDLVKHKNTGYMAKLRDVTDLAKGLQYILNMPSKDYGKMSTNCRKLAIATCSLKVVAKDYTKAIKYAILND